MPEEKKSPGPAQAKASTNIWATTLLDSSQQAFARWLEGMFALSQELARFTQERLEEDVSTWQSLAAAKSPDEAMKCQGRFAAKATEQYGEEMSKLSQMILRMAGPASVPLPPAEKRAA
jgi:phasin family protein